MTTSNIFLESPNSDRQKNKKATLNDVFEYYNKKIPPACRISCSPIMMLAYDLGVHPNAIRNWMNRSSGVPWLRAKQIKKITGIDILGDAQ